VREKERLGIALERVRVIRKTVEKFFKSAVLTPDIVELRNIALLAELIVMCARARQESRGLHYCLDHLDRVDPAVDTLIQRGIELAGETCLELDGKGR